MGQSSGAANDRSSRGSNSSGDAGGHGGGSRSGHTLNTLGSLVDLETGALNAARRGVRFAGQRLGAVLDTAVTIGGGGAATGLEANEAQQDRIAEYEGFKDMRDAQLELQTNEGALYSVCMSASGNLVAACGTSSKTMLWDVRNGKRVMQIRNPYSVTNCVALSADGSRLALCDRDGRAKVYEVGSARDDPRVFSAKGGTILRKVALNHNGLILAGAAQDGSLPIWEVNREVSLAVLEGHKGPAWSITMGHEHCVTCGLDATVRLWDLNSYKQVRIMGDNFLQARLRFWSVSMSSNADNPLVAACAEDCSIRVWSVSSGEEVAHLRHQQWVWVVSMNLEGERVASCGGHLIYIWDVGSSQVLQCFHVPQASWIWGICLSSDGLDVAGLSADGSMWVWDVSEATVKQTLRLP